MTLSVQQGQQQLAWLPNTLGGGGQSQETALAGDENVVADSGFNLFGDDGFTFADLVDIINPLQHFPIVSTLYREASGDALAPGPRVMGSTLYFGPIGLVGSLANVFVEEQTGKDVGQHIADWVLPDDGTQTPDGATAVAENDAGAAAFNGFEPAAGGAAEKWGAGLSADDPVSAWARGEVAWASKRAAAATQPGPARTAANEKTAPAVPDASRFLTDGEQWAARPDSIADIVSLTDDLRSASRAYQAAAGLQVAARG